LTLARTSGTVAIGGGEPTAAFPAIGRRDGMRMKVTAVAGSEDLVQLAPTRDGTGPARRTFKIIYLELTNACNFTCDYCPIDRQTRKKVVMAGEFARSILDQIAEHRLTNRITFHLMGEPFLHRELAALTGYAEERSLRVRLLTNGSLLDPQRNEALFDAGLSDLEVGFRTPNDSSFSMRLRGGSLTLEEYIRRVKGLIEDKIRLGAATNVMVKFFIRSRAAALGLGDSYEHLTSEADNLSMARLFQAHALEMAGRYGRPTQGWDDLEVSVVEGNYEILPGLRLSWSRIHDFWVREQRGNRRGKGWNAVVCGCPAGFRDDFGILANGDVTTCCVDYDGRNVIGNLHDHSLMEILDSDEAARIKRSLAWFRPPTQFCKECKGGPTLTSSVAKQLGTSYQFLKQRVLRRGVRTH
jgi:radical SAM protein with 4Fe4S-binding SPASM domain